MVLPIRLLGDPVLRTVADDVTDFGPELATLVDEMMETMDAYGGAGLAAPQVGVSQRVFVFNCGGQRGHIVNPVWRQEDSDTQYGPEGCLSVPGVQADTERFARVQVDGVDKNGAAVSLRVDGIMARCVQHETDHLDGVMFLQRLEPTVRKAAMRAVRSADWFVRSQTFTTEPFAGETVYLQDDQRVEVTD